MSTNYKKIKVKFFVLFVALARTATILLIIMEITPIKCVESKQEVCKRNNSNKMCRI